MLRVVLAVLLAVALLGAAAPAVEDARVNHTGTLAAGELSRLAERATGLAAAEETGPDAPARRVVALSLPSGRVATAPLEYVAVGGVPASEASEASSDHGSDDVPDCGTPRDTRRGDVVAYRVAGADPHVRYVPVDLRAVTDGRVRDDEDPLVIHGDARLRLSLVRHGGSPTVLVRRSEASGGDQATGGPDA